MKTFLVIGANGYVGRTICCHANLKHFVIPTHCNSQGNKSSVKYNFFLDDISKQFSSSNIDIVIFSAKVENRKNSELKKAMIRFALSFSSARMVYLSSDAVFAGEKGDYSEANIPNSKTVYGRNLLLCENIIRIYCPNHCIIRPSYLYGFVDGNLDRRLSATKKKLQRGQEVNLFCDMYKSPLGVQQFAKAVLKMATSAFIGTIHIAGHRTSVFAFHRQAMVALGVSIENLRTTNMPKESSLLKDTSLNISNWMRIAKKGPLSIKETLTGKNGAQQTDGL